MKHAVVATLSLFALAGCGGSGGTQTFEALLAEGDSIADASNLLEYTDPATLPANGTATYNGAIIVNAAGFDRTIGDMRLQANFQTDAITGQVSNVVTENEERLSGTLDITKGEIDRTTDVSVDFTFDAELDGELTGDAGTYVVDAELIGDFLGDDYGFAEGFVDGTVSLNGEASPIDAGAFIVER